MIEGDQALGRCRLSGLPCRKAGAPLRRPSCADCTGAWITSSEAIFLGLGAEADASLAAPRGPAVHVPGRRIRLALALSQSLLALSAGALIVLCLLSIYLFARDSEMVRIVAEGSPPSCPMLSQRSAASPTGRTCRPALASFAAVPGQGCVL